MARKLLAQQGIVKMRPTMLKQYKDFLKKAARWALEHQPPQSFELLDALVMFYQKNLVNVGEMKEVFMDFKDKMLQLDDVLQSAPAWSSVVIA